MAGSIPINSVHFGAHGRFGALRLDQSVTIRRNSAWYGRLLHIHGINLFQFGAIRCAWTDWCASQGSICNNSAHCDGLLHYRGINLQQFGTIRRAATNCCTFTGSICNNSEQFDALQWIGALLRDQSATIRHNSARCDRLHHFRGTNL